MFDSVHATLDLSPAGALFRQAAELGVTHEAALRSMLASAARRAGLAAIPSPLPDSLANTMFMRLPPPRVRQFPAFRILLALLFSRAHQVKTWSARLFLVMQTPLLH